MPQRNSPSFISALTIVIFVLLGVGLYLFNFNTLTVPLLWFLLPAGVLSTLVCSTFVSWKLFQPGSSSKLPLICLSFFLLAVAISAVAAPGVVLTVFLILTSSGIPAFVLFSQGVACASLIRNGVPKRCRIALILSVALAIATLPTATTLGSEKYSDAMEIPLYALIVSWLILTVVASLLVDKTSPIESTPETLVEASGEIKRALLLWTLANLTWIVVLIYIWGLLPVVLLDSRHQQTKLLSQRQ